MVAICPEGAWTLCGTGEEMVIRPPAELCVALLPTSAVRVPLRLLLLRPGLKELGATAGAQY